MVISVSVTLSEYLTFTGYQQDLSVPFNRQNMLLEKTIVPVKYKFTKINVYSCFLLNRRKNPESLKTIHLSK